MTMQCSECRWWNSYGDIGECRRQSPGRVHDNRAVWPVTVNNDWCGEFTEKKGDQNEGK